MFSKNLGGVQRSSVSCRDPTAEETHFIQWCAFIHFGQRDISHHCVLAERAGAHEVEDRLTFTGEPGRLIWHQTLSLGHPKIERENE